MEGHSGASDGPPDEHYLALADETICLRAIVQGCGIQKGG